jgi:Fic family protein
LDKANQITNPFEQAFFMMVHLPYLQPFDDVNKRVSRLACNISLIKNNLSPLSFVDVNDDLYIAGILGVYEFNSIELLKEVFIWAYQRSAARYANIRQTLGEPDPFRMLYREQIRDLIGFIVIQGLSQSQAIKHIQQQSEQITQSDQNTFIAATQTELMSLHEGNFARYRIRPSQFEAWQQVWLSKTTP